MATKKQLARLKAIEACKDKNGRIAPRAVWKAAKADPKHPLHKDFDWDVKSAAEKHWDETAARLMRQIKLSVVYDDVKIAAPYFVSDPSSRESAYIPTTVAAKREEVSETVLLDELRRIELAIIRARNLAATFNLVSYFDRMLDDVVEVRGHLDRRHASTEEARV